MFESDSDLEKDIFNSDSDSHPDSFSQESSFLVAGVEGYKRN